MKLCSFQPPVNEHRLPLRTPSPIDHLCEPLTPTCAMTNRNDPMLPKNGIDSLIAALQGYGGSAADETPAPAFERAVGRNSDSSTNGSSINALASVASSVAPHPLFSAPTLPPPHPMPQSPSRPLSTTSKHLRTRSDGQNRQCGHGHERPSKRARSGALSSDQYTRAATGPAASHARASAAEWTNGVEQSAKTGSSAYQAPTPPVSSSWANNDEMDIAQVLVGLRNGSIGNAHGARRSIAVPPAQYHSIQGGLSAWHDAATSVHLPTEAAPDQSASSPRRPRPHANSFSAPRPAPLLDGRELIEAKFGAPASSAVQTRTPPDETFDATSTHTIHDDSVKRKNANTNRKSPMRKPRDSRSKTPRATKSKAPPSVEDNALPPIKEDDSAQLHSPQSLPSELAEPPIAEIAQTTAPSHDTGHRLSHPAAGADTTTKRRSSFGMYTPRHSDNTKRDTARASSVPPKTPMTLKPVLGADQRLSAVVEHETTVCAACSPSRGPSAGQKDQWIGCNGCQSWYHFSCAGFKNAKEVGSVDKYFCRACKPQFGPTTFVRKSTRAQSGVRVDYAGLNVGVLRTSKDEHEHHYIPMIKRGTFDFSEETFPRMRPELITADNLEKSGGFTQPIVVPACWNPRPALPGARKTKISTLPHTPPSDDFYHDVEYETVPDEGQDSLDMVIPQGLTVRRVAELYGPDEKVEVIDVKSQEGEDKRWNMRKWADYYEEEGDKPVRNVISLEISDSKLGRLVRRPQVVRDLDLQDAVWPREEIAKGMFPKVQFYCLMSVADCYTDFHIDFGGSSVYYHIIKGKKTFFFIPPTKQNLKKYEDWCLSQNQNWTFLADETKVCYRVDLSEGDTMLIPSGWIHAVWTPENSLVIGGNFLTRLHYGMQIRVAEVEKNTKVARKFRYPHFQKVLWYAVLQYLQHDPLPQSVRQLLHDGRSFARDTPAWMQPDKFGQNSDSGPENYNARYYSRSELDGLPDLVAYIFRTVMISQGRVEGITVEVRNAVTRSIPKGAGDPLEIIKAFAVWVAWKRGNEDIPYWARPGAALPEARESGSEKKLSAAALKKLARKSPVSVPARASARQQKMALDAGCEKNASVALADQLVKHTSSPKTSVLGPKRVACNTCRRRRVRCKHKDEVSAPSVHTTPNATSDRRSSAQMVAVVIPKPADGVAAASGLSTADPKLATVHAPRLDGPAQYSTPDTGRRGRTRACVDCRKSKRRCIHDEYGNIDPIKAQEAPIPRGAINTKRRHVEEEVDAVKRLKKEFPPTKDLSAIISLSEHDVIPNGKIQPKHDPGEHVHTSSAPAVQPVDATTGHLADNCKTDTMTEQKMTENGVTHAETQPPQTSAIEHVPTSDTVLPSTESVQQDQALQVDTSVTSHGQTNRVTLGSPITDNGETNGVTLGSPITDNGQTNGVTPVSPITDNGQTNGVTLGSPMTDSPLPYASPMHPHGGHEDEHVSESRVGSRRRRSLPRSTAKGRAKSRTPRPLPSTKQNSVATSDRKRRASHASIDVKTTSSDSAETAIKVEDGSSMSNQRTMSLSQVPLPEEEEASLRLIRELVGKERGLRRRGSK